MSADEQINKINHLNLSSVCRAARITNVVLKKVVLQACKK